MSYKTVQQVARLAGITVRTLHHYDERGLLVPSSRSEAGYRLYDDRALARLHDILMWRELGFPLDEVAQLLDDPNHDPVESMMEHRRRLVAQVGALNAKISSLDEAIQRFQHQEPWQPEDLVALFEGFDPSAFEAEAEAQWGDTEAFAEAQRRTARYGPAEWAQIKAEGDEVNRQLADVLQRGDAPQSASAKVAAEAHRAYMSRWFYTCTPEIHLGLAELYRTDPRFQKTYDRIQPGLAAFVIEAIQALHAPVHRAL